MQITKVEKVSSSVSTRGEFGSFGEFATWLTGLASIVHDKKQSPAWSPALFSSGRLQRDAEAITALVFDFDVAVDLGFLGKLGLEHITHTTYTSPGSRVIIALSRPVAPSEWEGFWSRAADSLGLISKADPACKNVARIYFVPASPGPDAPTVRYFEGEPLPVDEFMSRTEDLSILRKLLLKVQREPQRASIHLALAGKPMAEQGNRDNTVSSLGFYLGKFVVPTTYSAEAVTEILRRGFNLSGRESASHWVDVFTRGFLTGRKEKEERNEESKNEQGLSEEWAGQLQMRTSMSGDVSVISNTHNAYVILVNEGTWAFRENVLEGQIEYRSGEGEFMPFDEVAATRVTNWLQRCYRCTLSKDKVWDQVVAVARNNQFDPIKAYLHSLKWDKKKRIDSFLTEYMGCEDGPLTKVYSRKWMIALVARALKPGCKMDDILTLQGAQGLGKSTAFRLLAEPWFSDSKIIIGDKDSYALAASSWVHECAELASLKRADLETMKNFFSSPEDYYRPVYGRVHIKRPRRCVFVATTNQDEFLRDETGNRRWWVVRCTKPIEFDKIARDKAQLLAEAVSVFSSGESWYLDSIQRQVQEADLKENHMEGAAEAVGYETELIRWLQSLGKDMPTTITVGDVVTKAWGCEIGDVLYDRLCFRAGRSLRSLGFVKVRNSTNGHRHWAWLVPVEKIRGTG